MAHRFHLDFPTDELTSPSGKELFLVPSPSPLRDRLIPLNTQGAHALTARMGRKPCRLSLVRWKTEGYPVAKNGPRVLLPVIDQIKRPMTTIKALHNFLAVVKALEDEISFYGGVEKWRLNRRKRR